MRTPRPAAIAATFSLAAFLAVTDLPGPGESSAHTRPPATSSADLAALRDCESGGDYSANSGNGYYGAYQFTPETWASVGGSGLPSEASPAEQDMRAQMLLEQSGTSPWPSCGG